MKNFIFSAAILASALSFGAANAQPRNNPSSSFNSVNITRVVAVGGEAKAISGDAVSVVKNIAVGSSNTNTNVNVAIPVIIDRALNGNTLSSNNNNTNP